MRRGGAMPGHYDGRKERSEWSVRRAKDVADPALVMPARGCPRRPAQRCTAVDNVDFDQAVRHRPSTKSRQSIFRKATVIQHMHSHLPSRVWRKLKSLDIVG